MNPLTYIDLRGYRMVKTRWGKWEREHRVVMGLKTGDRAIVHHRDGNKLNNDPGNLVVVRSQTEHNAIHGRKASIKRLNGCTPRLFNA